MNVNEIIKYIFKLVEEDKFDDAYCKCFACVHLPNLNNRDKSELFVLSAVVTIARLSNSKDMVYSMSIPFHINDIFQNILLSKSEQLIYFHALDFLDKAIETDSSNIKAYLYRGIIKHNLLLNKEAVNDFKKVIDSNFKEYQDKLIYGFMAYNLYYIGEYEETLKMKQNAVQSLVNKTLKNKINVQETIGMKNPFHYRNKAQYPVGIDKNGNPVIGVFADRTHEIIPIEKCFIQAYSF